MAKLNYGIITAIFAGALFLSPHFVYAETAGNQDDFIQAIFTQIISDFTPMAHMSPNHGSINDVRGLISIKQGNFTQAITDFNELIKADPNYSYNYFLRGVVYSKQGNFAQAISDYTKSVEINPKDAEFYCNRGLGYAKQSNFVQAISDFTKAMELDSDILNAYYGRGLAYYMVKEYDKSWADVHKIHDLGVEIDPKFIENLKKISGTVVEMDSHDIEFYRHRASEDAKQGNYVQAIADYTKVIEMKPDGYSAYSLRAEVYYALKEYDKAWIDVHKARDLAGFDSWPKFIEDLKKASGREN